MREVAQSALLWAVLALRLGDVQQARTRAEEALRLSVVSMRRREEGMSLHLLGQIDMAAGDPAATLVATGVALERARTQQTLATVRADEPLP
jgi:hypothetical protein